MTPKEKQDWDESKGCIGAFVLLGGICGVIGLCVGLWPYCPILVYTAPLWGIPLLFGWMRLIEFLFFPKEES